MERIEALKNYYESHNEDMRLVPKRGMVEFLTTVNYIEKYLKSGMNMLEIGAGSGRYSHYFALKGYEVDAVELMECNIEMFKEKTKASENIRIRQGDALDLSFIPDNKYDITLLLGTMYHLYSEKEQKKALSEAIRVTKKGGVIFASYCNNDHTAYHFGFLRGGFRNEAYKNMVDTATFKLSSTPKEIFALHRKEDIDKLMSEFKVKRLHYLGSDMLTRFIADVVDRMSDDEFDYYMKYHLTVCERSDMVGATAHILDVFRKE